MTIKLKDVLTSKMENLSQKKEENQNETIFASEKKYLEILVGEMAEAIENEEFDVLVGDDASGRLPTLFLRKVFLLRMKKKYPNLSDSEVNDKIKTFFVAGGRGFGNENDLKIFFEKIKTLTKKKILFVTEHIFTGDSLVKMAHIMKKAGLSFGVATMSINREVGIEDNISSQLLINELKNKKLFFSGGFGFEPNIYGKAEMSGVVKNISEKNGFSFVVGAHAKPIKAEELGQFNTKDKLGEEKNKARIGVEDLANQIEGSVFSEK